MAFRAINQEYIMALVNPQPINNPPKPDLDPRVQVGVQDTNTTPQPHKPSEKKCICKYLDEGIAYEGCPIHGKEKL